MPLRDDDIRRWLDPHRSINGGFRHTRLTEDSDNRADGLDALKRAVDVAHEDAKRHLDEMLGIDLDPLPGNDLQQRYPSGLNTLTLQGYLGELIAGLYAENFAPHGLTWSVPAFLFRFSNAAIEGLDRRLQLGGEATRTPGRTGDDCVAFLRDEDGFIVAWLNCEAKCSSTHAASLITDGHRQLNRPLVRPVSTYQLIEVLKDSAAPDATEWVDAIRVFWRDAGKPDGPLRADLFLYVCGRKPSRRESWMSPDEPEAGYSRGWPIEAVEVHLDDLDAVLTYAYSGHVIDRS